MKGTPGYQIVAMARRRILGTCEGPLIMRFSKSPCVSKTNAIQRIAETQNLRRLWRTCSANKSALLMRHRLGPDFGVQCGAKTGASVVFAPAVVSRHVPRLAMPFSISVLNSLESFQLLVLSLSTHGFLLYFLPEVLCARGVWRATRTAHYAGVCLADLPDMDAPPPLLPAAPCWPARCMPVV